jgi:hypothetical protein
MSAAPPGAPERKAPPLSAVLQSLADDATRERISVSDLLAALGDRALAALLFVFALPNVLPVPPGTSVVLGTPLVFLAAQLALGRAPWLPSVIMQRSMLRADFASLVRRMAPWLVRGERLLRPRLMALTTPPIEYVVGLVCLVLALVLALPIPLGNVLPALAICLLALGVLERDGLWVLAGLLTTAVSAAVVSGVIYAIVKAAIFFVTKVLQ